MLRQSRTDFASLSAGNHAFDSRILVTEWFRMGNRRGVSASPLVSVNGLYHHGFFAGSAIVRVHCVK